MAHVTLGAGLYSKLSYTAVDAGNTSFTTETELEGTDAFGASTGINEVGSLREFPSFGTPANIVNVPEYGEAVSRQVSAQADAPSLEFTVNYDGDDHVSYQALVSNQNEQWFRLSLQNDSAGTDITSMYVKGRFASVLVNPALDGANSATVTLATSSGYYGPFSN